jgi:hypothetical protein
MLVLIFNTFYIQLFIFNTNKITINLINY